MKILDTKLDVESEKQIVTASIVSTEFLKQVHSILKAEHLTIPYTNKLYRWVLEYYDKYKESPFKDIQDIFISKKEKLEESESELIGSLLNTLNIEYQQQGINVNYMVDKALSYAGKRELEITLEQAKRQLESGNVQKARKVIESCRPISTNPEQIFTAAELQNMDVQEVRWVIDGVVPVGLTLLDSKMKTGKSYFCLNTAIDLAKGDHAYDSIFVDASRVLYVSLEDGEQVLKDRLHKILGTQTWPDNLVIVREWSGIQWLENWMKTNPDTKLIIIDILARIRKKKAPGYDYHEDYHVLAPFQEFATKYGIGVIVCHHTRKAKASDVFDEISGTYGLSAAADTLAVLSRKVSDTRIYPVGSVSCRFRMDFQRF